MSMQFSSNKALIKTLNPPIFEQTSVFFIAKFLRNSITPFLKTSSFSLKTETIANAPCANIGGNVESENLSQAFMNLKHWKRKN